MKKTRILNNISLVSIALFVFLSLFSNINIVNANGVGPTQKFNTNFILNEYSKFNGSEQNGNSINITLPTSSWAIQDIKLNFTDIKFGKELIVIEDQNYTSFHDTVYHQNGGDLFRGLAIQIKLAEPTTIYGVDLYGKREKTTPVTSYVQIRGYNASNNIPNNNIYSEVEINMSTTEGWYRQTFPSSILLPKGNYSLVINGSSITAVNDYRYSWCYNNINPSNPSLYTSYYDETANWSTGVQNHIYLHKLIQKVNTPVYPEVINMTANIDNQLYPISNNTSEGRGYLGKIAVDFSPNSESYEIIVNNQASESLLFNVSYSVTLSNIINTLGSVAVQNGTTNKWSVAPTIARQPTNYSVLFNYPISWEDVCVFRDEVNVTLGVTIDTTNHKIIILNDSIPIGADWEIISTSPNIEFELNVQRTEYILGQELKFLLQEPILPGVYTFVLLDSTDDTVKNQTIINPSSGTTFSYNLSLSDLDGIYTVYVFLFSASGTNVGVQSETFEISLYLPPPTPPPEFPLPLIIFIIVLGAVSVGLVAFISYKKIQSGKRTKLEKFLNKCTDISNINDVIVVDTKSGIDIFSQSFGGRRLDTSLISGFLQAISNFGMTISEAAKESRTLTIEYKDSIVMQTEFVNLKLVVTLKENPSANFKFIMEDLAYDIYKQYGQEIEKFTGILKPFHNMSNLIEKHLKVSFLYPLTIVEIPKIKLTTAEKEMVNKARIFMRENNFNHFYSLYLLPENVCTPKDYQTIFDLIEKGVFRPKKE